MAVTLTGAAGLFTILGKAFFVIDTTNTQRGLLTTEVQDVITQHENLADTVENQAVIAGLESSHTSYRQQQGLVNYMEAYCSRLIVELVNADNEQEKKDLRTAVNELITQMIGAGSETAPDDDVDASVVGATVAATAGNIGDLAIAVSPTRADGRNLENSFAEDIVVEISSTATQSVRFRGEVAESDRYSADWPKGSGSSRTVAAGEPSGGLLLNGGMDDEDDRANTPDDWILDVGVIGTTVKMTDYEAQTVIISLTPTSGYYTLTYTDVNSKAQTTVPIIYNAAGSAVQTALRNLKGLENVTVVQTGTTPNFTNTITFTKMDPPGNIGLLTSSNNFDVGSIAHAETIAATAHVYRDKALEIDSDGAELTAIKQAVAVAAETAYVFCGRFKVDAFPAAGVVTVDLTDGAGTVINDDQGTANSFTINPLSGGDLSTSAFTAITGFFRTPTSMPTGVIYLRIRITTAISATASLFVDEVDLRAATQLYKAGPFVGVFRGQTVPISTDTWTVTVTNDRAGLFQEHWFRAFGLDDLLLPSDNAGGETIVDTLIG